MNMNNEKRAMYDLYRGLIQSTELASLREELQQQQQKNPLFLVLLETVKKRVFDGFIQGNPLCDIIFKHPLYEIKQLLVLRATGDQVLLQETIINKKSVAIQKFVSMCLNGLKQIQNLNLIKKKISNSLSGACTAS